MAVPAQVRRDHANVSEPRGQSHEAQPMRLDAVQTQQRPPGRRPELLHEQWRRCDLVHDRDCRR
jgi:hypothetical protein